MTTDTTHSILRSARSFLAGTLVSRVSGLCREIAMAISFGSSPEIAAFMVSFRLANLMRRILGEGNLQAGFIPHFEALKEEGKAFYRDVTVSMTVVLLFAVGLLEIVLWACKPYFSADWAEIIELTMWMTPGTLFICLFGLNAALLQCRKKFFLVAVAPVAFNFVWISATLFRPDVRFLSIAITVAFAGQWLMTVFEGAKVVPAKEWLKARLFSPDFKALIKPLALGVIGVSAVQLNSALDAIFARLADPEGPAFLWYAVKVEQLPFGLFGMALSGALLPPLSRAEDPLRRHELLQGALKQSALLMLICSFGIFALGLQSINLLYGHGSFTPSNVQSTTDCLWAYGVGLTPSVFVLLLAARFYAEKNYRLPALASLLAVFANVTLNALFVFVFGWGAVSIAIATSLSAFLNMAVLGKNAFTRSFCAFLFKTTLTCAVPAALTFFLAQTYFEPSPRAFSAQLIQFSLLAFFYLGSVALLAWRLGLTTVLNLRKTVA